MSGPGTPTLPKCKDCGKRTDRVVSVGTRHEFVCADCEYLREKPDAPRFIKPPRERAKRLQKESLLDLLSEPVTRGTVTPAASSAIGDIETAPAHLPAGTEAVIV